MAKFYPLVVSHKQRETEDCVSLTLEVPSEFSDIFQFQHGQHLTLKTSIDGTDVSRSYSICASPGEGNLRVAVKKVPGGQFSTFANDQLSEGDQVLAMPPSGHFNSSLSPEHEKYYLTIAAGSGITPIISIAKTILQTEPDSQVVLFYGNRKTDSIIFLEELEALKNKYVGRFILHHFLTGEKQENKLFAGRIDSEKLNSLSKLFDYGDFDEVFICGPEEMMAECAQALKNIGVAEEKIHLELFTSPVGKLGQTKPKTEKAVEIKSHVTVIMDGMQYQFPTSSGQDAILDQANDNGADLPFSCKGGVCSTCKAKLLEGKVEMDVNYALEPDEIEAGYILTCQAHPITENVVVSFDEA